MKKFNLNEYMYIQIFDSGWSHLENTVGQKYVESCIKSREFIINNESWYKLQCHEVFSLFVLNFGGNLMFGVNVMLDDSAFS